jgi:uncharacterized protein YwgA
MLALAIAGERGLTPIQIQKAMFLLRMEALEHVGDQFYQFQPYNYGPFNSLIYSDVDALVREGLLREQQYANYSRYFATDVGRQRAEEIGRPINSEAKDFLTRTVQWIQSVDFGQLLRSIYAKYPPYAVNSIFRS